jgi:L-threonylcarbamoyladenylate synthase
VTGSTVADAVAALRAGELVAFPTETVYGLGADATDARAVRRVFEVKGRPSGHPLIVHLAPGVAPGPWARRWPASAAALTEACWPGPLTVLVPRGPAVIDEVTGGRPAVGLRVPAHPLAIELLEAFGGGIAAPSANRFGRVSPTTAAHVRADLGDDVAVVLDGGPSRIGVESTIVDCTVDPPMLLRAGGVPVEVLTTVLGGPPAAAGGPSRAPGMLASHYAPDCAVELAEDAGSAAAAADRHRTTGRRVEVLDPGADVAAYAHHLYGWLRDADARGVEVLVVVTPPDTGLGAAVRDRLRKAAAPRDVRGTEPGRSVPMLGLDEPGGST